MAKGSGRIRMSTSKGFEWSHSDSYEDVLHDAQQIFKKEATAGLGNFMQRKPKKVTDTEYEKLLKSGDYIEIVHGSSVEGINELVNGKYYINNDLHVAGFGYYFSKDKTTGEGYSAKDGERMITALIKKKRHLTAIRNNSGRPKKRLRQISRDFPDVKKRQTA